jgi:NUMOD3 motif
VVVKAFSPDLDVAQRSQEAEGLVFYMPKKGFKHSAQSRAKIREARKRQAPWSEETRQKMRAIMFGRKHTPEALEKMRGERASRWKGDEVGYGGIHIWMRHTFGQPRECDHCGTTEAKRYEWANLSKEYKRDRADWLRLCNQCHQKYDDTRRKAWASRRLRFI